MSDPSGIRKFLAQTGLTSLQFAAMLGVHPTTLSRWTTSLPSFEQAEGMSGIVARRVVILADDWRPRDGRLLIDKLETFGPIEAFRVLCVMATSVPARRRTRRKERAT